MKTKKNKKFKRIPISGIALLLIAGFSIISMLSCGQQEDNGVMKAYELRMQGKVDDALALIDSLLIVDSTNALAHFERFRIYKYMMTGGGDVSSGDMLVSIEKATEYEPDNIDFAYNKAIASFLNAYIMMNQGQGDVKNAIASICDEFKHVLSLQPDHPQSMLYLVDIYSQLPEEMGGDSEKAAYYYDLLQKSDEYYAAKAELLVNPQEELAFWLAYLDSHEKNPDVLKEIGTAYIYEEDPDNAFKYYSDAIAIDPDLIVLILNPARYYMFLVMQRMAEADSVLPLSADYINQYLLSEPKPNTPMQAYAFGMLSRIERVTGNQKEGMEFMEKAKALDPYFSRATGVPSASLFDPPDKLVTRYSSFFLPF